ncbi:hypothetical protein [Rivularia sp. UHCC 0363]|uniref:hypothetical protein n=1 Tax=Rivularia sp. UHCC 0363 TaxID=3110244 RepID=UPI002B1EC79F|nr:hypothetical protein [Rivularia sp. UHCC 0363]MEA5598733.1 hypothetical protein [Rivularia sp. UHCC 0363]
MTRFPYDQFAKDYLKELLQPLGEVETSRKVPAEIREIDVYFVPSSQPTIDKIELGLLGRFADKIALFEPYRNAVKISEIRSCMKKVFYLIAEIERGNKRVDIPTVEEELPKVWVLTPTASIAILDSFNAIPDEENWGKGIYFLGESAKTAIVVIHQLPRIPETLWLRLLGKGNVQKQAIAELQALPPDNPLRAKAINAVLSLRSILEITQNQNIDEEDRELVMALSPLYLQQLEEAKQEGVQEGVQRGVQQGVRTVIENLLQVRFGSSDEELSTIVEPISRLSPQEFTPLLLQLSREELLNRFGQR